MSDYEMLMVVIAIIGLVLIRDIDQKKITIPNFCASR